MVSNIQDPAFLQWLSSEYSMNNGGRGMNYNDPSQRSSLDNWVSNQYLQSGGSPLTANPSGVADWAWQQYQNNAPRETGGLEPYPNYPRETGGLEPRPPSGQAYPTPAQSTIASNAPTQPSSNLFNPGAYYFPGGQNYNPSYPWASIMAGGPGSQEFYQSALQNNPALAQSQSLPTLQPLNAFSFNPQDLQNEPGYQFQLGEGKRALTENALARGSFFTPQTAIDLNNYAQGLAGTTYNNAFNRALQQYATNAAGNQQNYGQSATNFQLGAGQNNQLFNMINQNQLNNYNLRNNALMSQQGLFQNSNQNMFNNLMGMASLGAGVTGQGVSNAFGTGQGVGNTMVQGANTAGQAQVASQLAPYSGFSTGLGQIGNAFSKMNNYYNGGNELNLQPQFGFPS